MDNILHEECGIMGAYNCLQANQIAYYCLHALQHRGQESCGIIANTLDSLKVIKGPGLVTEVFDEEKIKRLESTSAIGHVRYAGTKQIGLENIQPFLFHHHLGDFAIANNGSIVNAKEIRESLERQGSIFQSLCDSELLAHLMKKNYKDTFLMALQKALRILEGSFAFVILCQDKLYVCRDKHGLRPLSLAKLGNGYVVASETCAFASVGAEFIRDVKPGEILQISDNGLEVSSYSDFCHYNMCAMEYIYFSRPDSNIQGLNVHTFRRNSGKVLAKVAPVDADIVVGVPDSSLSAAIGYAEESKIPYETGLIKNRYIGRTFIQPSQELREKTVMMKLSAISSVIAGKKVVLVDDSIVRGTTSKRIVKLLKEAGAIEVHVRISSPPFTHPCIYGVDISTYEELIGAKKDAEGIRKEIGADSLAYLSVEDIFKSAGNSKMCMACFTGSYPTNIYGLLKDINKEVK